MILKDVNGEYIFPAKIGGIEVRDSRHCPSVYRRPYEGFNGWALCVESGDYDSELGFYVEERKVIAWYDSCDRAKEAKQLLLDGFTLTVPSKVAVA